MMFIEIPITRALKLDLGCAFYDWGIGVNCVFAPCSELHLQLGPFYLVVEYGPGE